jgi:hypothetical protein
VELCPKNKRNGRKIWVFWGRLGFGILGKNGGKEGNVGGMEVLGVFGRRKTEMEGKNGGKMGVNSDLKLIT